MTEKTVETIQDIIVFFTPRTIDRCFEFLQKKIRKTHKIDSLLLNGDELPNLSSETFVFNKNLPNIFPHINLKAADPKNKSLEPETEVDLNVEQKLKQFARNQKKNKVHKSCIIDKKAS